MSHAGATGPESSPRPKRHLGGKSALSWSWDQPHHGSYKPAGPATRWKAGDAAWGPATKGLLGHAKGLLILNVTESFE